MTSLGVVAEPTRAARLRPAPGPQSASLARHAAARLLSEWQLGDDTIETARLLVSELVADAWLHAGGAVAVDVEAGTARLRISVMGDPYWLPQPGHRGSEAEFGGRLWLMSTLASRWGVVSAPEGKRVWAEFDIEGDGAGMGPTRGRTWPWARLLEVLLPQRGALVNAQAAVEANRREAQQRREAALAMALAARHSSAFRREVNRARVDGLRLDSAPGPEMTSAGRLRRAPR